jgi:hypothetical protein
VPTSMAGWSPTESHFKVPFSPANYNRRRMAHSHVHLLSPKAETHELKGQTQAGAFLGDSGVLVAVILV